jgi:hypothetical protein
MKNFIQKRPYMVILISILLILAYIILPQNTYTLWFPIVILPIIVPLFVLTEQIPFHRINRKATAIHGGIVISITILIYVLIRQIMTEYNQKIIFIIGILLIILLYQLKAFDKITKT